MIKFNSIKKLAALGISILCCTVLMPLCSNNARASHRIHRHQYNTNIHNPHNSHNLILVNQSISNHRYKRYRPLIKYYYKPQTKRRSYIVKRHNIHKYKHKKSIKPKLKHLYRKKTNFYRYRKNKKKYTKKTKKYIEKHNHKSYISKYHSKKHDNRVHTIKYYQRYHVGKAVRKIKSHKHISRHRTIRKHCQKYIRKRIARKVLKPLKRFGQRKHKIDKQTKQNKRQNRCTKNVYQSILSIAKSKLGDNYVWGGNGPDAFDCSGFTKYIYQYGAHKTLPRLAGDQYYYSPHVPFTDRRPGDLVFFGTNINNITHVGMYIGNDMMIDDQLRGVIIEKISVPWWHAVGYSRPLA